MNIGKSLKSHREANNLSQTQLAKLTGIKQQNISRWENNTHIPDVVECIMIARVYGISIEELIGIDETTSNKTIQITYNNSTHNGNNYQK